ncbi:radical SAM/SPASM domain-containing protein [Echinicola pacifica]|nr:radical SAM/SPASM domain-containing protein [Echinicola pacifica]
MKSKVVLGIQFFKYLSWAKVRNAVSLYLSFWKAQWFRKPLIQGLPAALSIEPTTGCNLRCPECPSGLRSFSRPTGMLDTALYQKIIQEVSPHLAYLHLYFQGEPFLHPQFLELVKYADQHKIFTATSTNAHFLNEKTVPQVLDSGLKQLIVSVDGATQEVYENYRIGGKLDRVLAGIDLLIKSRRARHQHFPQVIFQFLVTGQNEHELSKIKSLAKSLGVDELQLKTAQIYNYENGSPLIPSDLRYSRYLPDGMGKWKLKKELRDKCWRMWQGAVITWDGDVLPCCYDKDGKYTMGNIGITRLAEIWKNVKYGSFRNQIFLDRSEIDICKNCME